MEKQTIRTFGRRHGKKLSARKTRLMEFVLPKIAPRDASDGAVLEIGFGAGEHVREMATARPETIFVGAEPFANGVAAMLSAITDEQTDEILPEYKNIRVYPDDVRLYLDDVATKFSEIWVLHPDPWPKAKHEKRRLLSAEFLTMLSRHLTDDGKIIIGTDHWEYYTWIEEQITRTPLIKTGDNIDIIQTRYQQKNKAGTIAPKYLILSVK